METAPGLAPVALFIFKRPEHVRRTIASLRGCHGYDESPLYVFADGPRTREDAAAVREARAVARELAGDRAVFVEQETNRGLANSIIAGVSTLCERHGAAIVVEDDLVLSPWFLRFLNDGLVRYTSEPRVMQISGHMFNVGALAEQPEALFLPMTTSWGWATWKRAWDLFDPDASGWQDLLDHAGSRERFDLDGAYPYSDMLRRQMAGRVDSWAIRWYYSVFRNEGLSLFPPQTLVVNAGFDRSGTHGRRTSKAVKGGFATSSPILPPGQVEESPAKQDVFDAIDASQREGGLTGLAMRSYRSFQRFRFTHHSLPVGEHR